MSNMTTCCNTLHKNQKLTCVTFGCVLKETHLQQEQIIFNLESQAKNERTNKRVLRKETPRMKEGENDSSNQININNRIEDLQTKCKEKDEENQNLHKKLL